MSADLNAHALDLALDDAPPTGDTDLDAAVALALADIAAIRRGLALIGAELPTRDDEQVLTRPSRRRAMALTGVVAVVVLAAIGGWATLGGGGSGSQSSSSAPQFLLDMFDYRPGVVGSSLSYPALGYSVPELSGISAASANDAWIVGDVAWHWEGSSWFPVVLPAVSGPWHLSSNVTLGQGEAWAVGWHSGPMEEIVGTHPLVEHWDGTRWSVIHLRLSGPGAFNSVSASAPNDVWAAGWWEPEGLNRAESEAAIRPLVAHWDGGRWHVIHLPAPGLTSLSQVVALAADDVWVAGPGMYRQGAPVIRRWDGKRWRSIRAPFGAGNAGFRLTATSATDAWAVGGQNSGGHSKTLAAHWNGRTWKIAPTPNRNTNSMLLDVHAISPTDVWALGQSQFMKHTGNETRYTIPVAIYEHWNGELWSLAPASSEREGLEFLAAAPDGTVWAAGNCYYQDIITRWNGHTWRPVRHPPDITWQSNIPGRDRHAPTTTCLSHSPNDPTAPRPRLHRPAHAP